MEDEGAIIEGGITLFGHILIPASAAPIEQGVAKVQLEEITGEDAPAVVIAEVNLPDIRHAGGVEDTLIPFTISLPGEFKVDSRKDHAIRVWIDTDGNGRRSSGDLYSSERKRVFSGDGNHPILIRVGP